MAWFLNSGCSACPYLIENIPARTIDTGQAENMNWQTFFTGKSEPSFLGCYSAKAPITS
jgi:hypothetical protein